MRWAVGCVATAVLTVGCSSPLAPQRLPGGTDAAVEHARPIDRPVIDAREQAPIGTPCQAGSDCLSGFCVDGVCCFSACTGPCATCARPGAAGTCFPIDLGAAARPGGCPSASPATCGLTGMCDGVGGCELYPAETLCAQPTCVDGTTVQVASTCDGLGTCRPGPTQSCVPYTCVDGACFADDCQFNPADCDVRPNRDASSD